MLSRVGLLVPVALFAGPACLLVQPLDEAYEGDAGAAGSDGGTAGFSPDGGSSGASGSTSGKSGSSAGGSAGSDAAGGKGSGGTNSSSGKGGSDGGDSGETGSGGSGAGRGGNGGSGGGQAGSAGSGGELFYTPVWPFDFDNDGFQINSATSTTLRESSTLVHDANAGEPDSGSLLLTVPFTESAEDIKVAIEPIVPIDLTGVTLAARVRVEHGLGLDDAPGGAQIYVQTGSMYDWSAAGFVSITAADGWQLLTFDWDDLADASPDVDPGDVRLIGIQFYSGGGPDASWDPTQLYIDSVGWTDVSRLGCARDPLLIDDMETLDGQGWICQTNRRNGVWYAYDDGTTTGAMRTPSGDTVDPEVLSPARDDSTQAIHISGSGYTNWGGAVGINLAPTSNEAVTFYDVSAYGGIEFWARGSGDMQVQVQIPATRDAALMPPGECEEFYGTSCDDHFAAPLIALTDTWQQYRVPWSSLEQQGFGLPKKLDYRLFAIDFHFPVGDAFDFWIDDVSLFLRECQNDSTSCDSGVLMRCAYGTPLTESCSEICGAGFASGSCAADGTCQCDGPTDPMCVTGVDQFCMCASAEGYECVPRGKMKLYQQCVDGNTANGEAMACFVEVAEAECATNTCWTSSN